MLSEQTEAEHGRDAVLPNGETQSAPLPEPQGQAGADSAETAGQYLEMLQRTRADYENYQKRMRRELETQRRYASLAMARDLLPILDNMHRAIEAAEQTGNADALIEGVTMVSRQLEDVLQRHDVRPIDAVGLPLDPNFHEAVGARPTTDYPPHAIVQELQKGYQMHERVVRPSKVIVAQAPPPVEQSSETQEEVSEVSCESTRRQPSPED